jgi:hydroxymethylpyrimidine pyrophosphatase-like HAD family hydrolase
MKIILSDFDGTLTTSGKLSAVFFEILEKSKSLNTEFVIVSGRSISWGHFLLTHYPIDFCIMEGGGVLVYKEGDLIKQRLFVDKLHVDELEIQTQFIKKKFPNIPLSADSFGRLTDRAIEFKDMKGADIKSFKQYLDQKNIKYSQSNVHINLWCGDISKAQGTNEFLAEFFPKVDKDECLFFGDAMNDESMFKEFKETVGVSNISKYIDQMTFKPKVVLKGPENSGAQGVFNYLNSI